MRISGLTALLLGLLLWPHPSPALMPPHLTGSVPEAGGVLATDTMRLDGYTLFKPEPNQLTLTDLTTGQAAGWEVTEVNCEDEGDWERAQTDDGAIQFRCALFLRLTAPMAGHEYELLFLDTPIRFTYAPEE